MTLADKVGQMTQLNINLILKDGSATEIDQSKLSSYLSTLNPGSWLNSPTAGGPIGGVADLSPTQWASLINQIQSTVVQTGNKIPMLYGIDSVHGANYIYGATLFPQEIGAAATFNRTALQLQGAITAKDMRASNVPWTFSPILGLATQPLWSRFYETFGEDPYLSAEMARSVISGYQGFPADIGAADKISACMKHFLGYSEPRSGQDRTPAWIPDRQLYDYYLKPFKAAVETGVATVMSNSGEINGVPVHSSHQYLETVLREMIGFQGMLVTDWQDIEKLQFYYHLVPTQQAAVTLAINQTSIDMSMVPEDISFFTFLTQAVQQGVIPEQRVDVSVARILQLKHDLGLLDNPMRSASAEHVASVGSPADRDVALETIRESVTLLQNTASFLPLATAARNVLVTGPCSNSLRRQSGGWTLHWQGAQNDSEFAYGTTILQGVQGYVGPSAVTYFPGSQVDTSDPSFNATIAAAKTASVVIVCVGEEPYAETPGDITDLTISQPQQDLVNALVATGTKVVVVLVEGRPRVLNGITNNAAAVLHAYLPGPDGGQGIADILFGNVNPSGRLPFTYPLTTGVISIPYWHAVSQQPFTSQWNFGFGLSYTTFAYTGLAVTPASVVPGQNVTVTVTVTNTGSRAGKDAVLLYLSDLYRIITPEVKMLKGFEKVSLASGGSQTVSFTLTTDSLSFYGLDNTLVYESGTFMVAVGNLTAQFAFVA